MKKQMFIFLLGALNIITSSTHAIDLCSPIINGTLFGVGITTLTIAGGLVLHELKNQQSSDEESGPLLSSSHNTLNRRKKYLKYSSITLLTLVSCLTTMTGGACIDPSGFFLTCFGIRSMGGLYCPSINSTHATH